MKKKLLICMLALALTGLVKAQDNDCMPLFPETPGVTLVTKNYDAKDKLLHSTIYTVLDATERMDGKEAAIGFVITDSKGRAIDQGDLDVQCNGGVFFLKMINKTMSTDIMKVLSEDTNLVGEFLDYPNTFADTPYESDFKMSGGEYTIETKDGKESLRVRVYDRTYEKNEEVTTPAGIFEASKISFYFDVTQDKKTVTYKGVEWYALRAGIVRSETYLEDKLQNYTVLTTVTK